MLKFLNWATLFTSIGIAGIAFILFNHRYGNYICGAYIGTIVMMSALEVGKLVTEKASYILRGIN